jgi:exportin-1
MFFRCWYSGTDQVKSSILQSLWFLLRISSVEDVVIFKICLEYWMVLVMDLYNTVKMQPSASPLVLHSRLFKSLALCAHFIACVVVFLAQMLGRFVPQQPSQRVAMYGQLLSQLRLTMIGRMAKPEEVRLSFFFVNLNFSNRFLF